MKKTILGLMAVVVIATFSCTKEVKEESIPVTTEAVTGAYTLTKVEGTIGGIRGDMTSTYYSDNGMGECSRDNIKSFLADGTYNVSEGAVVCDPAVVETGFWAVENGILKIDGADVEVELFSATTLRYAEGYNGTDKIIYTYTRQ